jgi:putative sporulation protein YyaC
MKQTLYFNPEKRNSLNKFTNKLLELIKKTKKDSQPLVLVCIGTDRATGDCLGPLVGHYLEKCLNHKFPVIFGNLSQPVHAVNLMETMEYIYSQFSSPYIIVIDACLGCARHVGYVTLSNYALQPGKGVDKDFPPVGNISITGIVDQYGEENFSTIQNTHLHQVVNLADFIANGITDLISYHHL